MEVKTKQTKMLKSDIGKNFTKRLLIPTALTGYRVQSYIAVGVLHLSALSSAAEPAKVFIVAVLI